MTSDKRENTSSPLVTVITVNCQSMSFSDVLAESIKAILALKHRPLEVIIVDNGSSDGSYKYLSELVDRNARKDTMVRLLRLRYNCGFALANNIAFASRNNAAKYVAIINNDLIPTTESLGKLVELLERNQSVAAIQGKILSPNRKIDCAGCYLSQYGYHFAAGKELPAGFCNRPAWISFSDGAYSVYRIKTIEESGSFFLPFFMYGEDWELGTRLWKHGHRVMYSPILAGTHYRSSTTSNFSENMKRTLEYCLWRAEFTLICMYDRLLYLHVLLRLPSLFMIFLDRLLLRGIIDGVLTGVKWRRKFGTGKPTQFGQPRLKLDIFGWYVLQLKFAINFPGRGIRRSKILYTSACKHIALSSSVKGRNMVHTNFFDGFFSF